MDTQLFVAGLALCGFVCFIIGYVVGCVETGILKDTGADDFRARER